MKWASYISLVNTFKTYPGSISNGRRVHVLHGFNVRDNGDATVGQLIKPLRDLGYTVIHHKWGWRGLFGTWFFNSKLVERLTAQIKPSDTVVGHSDGGNIAFLAAEKGAHIGRLILVNPALDNDKELPEQVEACLVFADPGDLWVRISSKIPFNRWGEMGATGPTSDDPRYITVEHPYSHSGIFKKVGRVRTLVRVVDRFLRAERPTRDDSLMG